MDVSKNNGYEPKQPIVLSIYSLCVALVAIIVFQLGNGAEITHEKDIAHWFGLVIEIGIAIGIAIVVWHYTKYEQTKTNSLIMKINDITSKLEAIIQEQNRVTELRRKFIVRLLRINLHQAQLHLPNHDDLVNYKPIPKKMIRKTSPWESPFVNYAWALTHLESMTSKLDEYTDVIHPDQVFEIKTISRISSKVRLAIKKKAKIEEIDHFDEQYAIKLVDELKERVNKILNELPPTSDEQIVYDSKKSREPIG